MTYARKAVSRLLRVIALVINNRRRYQPVKGFKKYYLLAKGFMNESTVLYQLTLANYRDYLSDTQIMKTSTINQEAAYYLNDKIAFVEMLEDKIKMPKTFATIYKGRIEARSDEFTSVESLLAYLKQESPLKIVIKPIAGAEGRGVSIIKWAQGQLWLNKQAISESTFIKYLETLDDYFISEFIQQGQFSQQLSPQSLNTIRMLTVIDPVTEKAILAAAVYRVGTQRSAPTDNFRRHGLSVAIDPMSGQLGQVARLPQDGQVRWLTKHPDTQQKLTGLSVPDWPQVKKQLLEVAEYVFQTKQIKYVGWDIVILDEGLSLLEGNSRPGVSLHQVHHPLLQAPRIKAFYQYHKII